MSGPAWRFRVQLLLVSLGLSVVAQLWLTPPSPGAPNAAAQLVQLLARDHGLEASPSDVFWVKDPTGLWPVQDVEAWLLASKPSALADVYLVRAVRVREGGVLRVAAVHNLSATFAIDERNLSSSGTFASWALGDAQLHYRLRTAHAAAQRQFEAPLSFTQRLQWHLTWWQQTGQWWGVSSHTFKLEPAAKRLQLSATSDGVVAVADGHHISINKHGQATAGGSYVLAEPQLLPAPGNLVTWAVDRVRAWPAFGDERMQWLKAVAYRAVDWSQRWLRTQASVAAPEMYAGARPCDHCLSLDNGHTGAATPHSSAPAALSSTVAGSSKPWPPPRLEPLLQPALEGEGLWQSSLGDPFVRNAHAELSTFYTSFIRTDPERRFARVFVVAWDPANVQLHAQSGTEEPHSATGARSKGQIPRDPALLTRVVGAFNGGFQATHGDFGMMEQGTLLVPPLAYSATVARLKDGSTAFGTWPASAPVPDFIESFRQNLTPLVAQGRYNPYGRTWWGGVPQGWQDDTQTVRSGLCLTRHGHVAYFYGTQVDVEHLAKAMLSAACDYGLHLDMNQGHAGLEFYRVDTEANLPPLAVALDAQWQAEAPLADVPGYRYRGRRLFRGMQLMNFPRYIATEARDFFYLSLRPRLPETNNANPNHDSAAAAPAAPGTDSPAYNLSVVRPLSALPEARVRLLTLDAARLLPSFETPAVETLAQGSAPLSISPPPSTGQRIWWQNGTWRVADTPPQGALVPPDAAVAAVAIFAGTAAPAAGSRAAAGLTSDGMLVYAQLTGGQQPQDTAELLRAALNGAGVRQHTFLQQPADVRLAGRDLDLHPSPAPAMAIYLRHAQPKGFHALFNDTPVVERKVWQPLQQREP